MSNPQPPGSDAERAFELGESALRAGQLEAALVHFNDVVQARPDLLVAALALGCVLIRLSHFEAAFHVGRRAEAIEPLDPRGRTLQWLAQQSARAPLEVSVERRVRFAGLLPDSAGHQYLCALNAARYGQYDEAHQALDAVVALAPSFLPARWVRFLTPRAKFFASDADIAIFLSDWDIGCAEFSARRFDTRDEIDQVEGVLMAQCNFHLGYSGHDVTARHHALGDIIRRMAASAFGDPQPATPARHDTRIRIGFLTPTLRRHTVMKLFGGLMRSLPADRFEVYAYALEGGNDSVTEQLRVELAVVRTELSDLRQMAQQIADDRCDALVYLDIGMHPRTAALAALRLAPFQAALWGHPISSGLETIDAFISCAAMEPSSAQSHYRERLLTLPGIGCHYDPADLAIPPDALPPRLDTDRVRIVCAQNGVKLLPVHDEVFARILAASPASDLVILSGMSFGGERPLAARLRPAFEARAVDFDARVRVIGQCSESRFLTELWQADLVLDAFSWSGGVTALETFAGDVPILTLPGAFMRGRHTLAMLEALDLPELVAVDVDDYVARAIALAGNERERTRLKQLIAQRKQRLYRQDIVADAFIALIEREVAARH